MSKITISTTLNTDGSGFWSERTAAVAVTGLELAYVAEDNELGELLVYFDNRSWNTRDDGLIYTDQRFQRELLTWLDSIGLTGDTVSYSEQGMQGDNYVSLDVGRFFIEQWQKKGLDRNASVV